MQNAMSGYNSSVNLKGGWWGIKGGEMRHGWPQNRDYLAEEIEEDTVQLAYMDAHSGVQR